MKKLISFLIIIQFALGLFGHPSKYYDQEKAKFAEVIFKFAKEQLPELEKINNPQNPEIQKDKYYKIFIESQIKSYKIINLIYDRDIQGLIKLDSRELQLPQHYYPVIELNGVHLNNLKMLNTTNNLASVAVWGNFLAFVLFHSLTNKTEEDNKKTLSMLKILLGKGCKPNDQAGITQWIKKEPNSDIALDFPAIYSLVEFAVMFSFPEALKALLQAGTKFDRNFIKSINPNAFKNNKVAKEFKKVLSGFRRH